MGAGDGRESRPSLRGSPAAVVCGPGIGAASATASWMTDADGICMPGIEAARMRREAVSRRQERSFIGCLLHVHAGHFHFVTFVIPNCLVMRSYAGRAGRGQGHHALHGALHPAADRRWRGRDHRSMFIMLPSMKASCGKLGTLLALGAISSGSMCMPGMALAREAGRWWWRCRYPQRRPCRGRGGAVVIAHRNGRRALQHAHAAFHVVPAGIAPRGHHARHAADSRGHLVHVVVRQVAVQHPVAGIVGDELDIARLRNADEHSVARPPRGFGNPAAFGAGDVEGLAVQMHRMMVHAKVHEADAHAAAERHDHRRDRGAGLAVEDEPVVLHAHGVGDGARGEDGILLQVDEEIVVDRG